ncbi:MAG: HEAT repeat domain-containing protein [Myxococcales bacterium]|nr:HEAT repeat domain-containing protein [Myxococcales bacterium]
MPKGEDFTSIPIFEPSPSLIASAYPDDIGDLAAGMSDEQAIKKIGQRSSTSGKIITFLMVAGAAAMVYFYMQSSAAYESRMDGVLAAGELEGEAMLAALRAEVDKSEYDDVQVRAIRNLSHFKDQQSVPQFIKALDKPGIVRRAAALALANVGSPAADSAKPKLLQVLPDTDAKDRPQVVWALAVLKEQQATDAILELFTGGLLQNQPGFDPKILTEAIGIAKLSSPELTGHDKKPVRALVAMALSEAASPQVVPPLVRMIGRDDEDGEVVRAAVAGLGRAGDPAAGGPLFDLMQKRPEMRQSVIDALAKSTAAPQLATLLGTAKDAAGKRDLVRLLRKTYDPRSADALAGLVNDQDADTKEEAVMGLADLGDSRAVPALIEMAKSEDDDVANDAVDALRRLANPEAAPALLALFDEFPYRKAAIMRALGTTGAEQACPNLVKEIEGDDIGAATKAIGQLPCEKAYGTLVGLLPRSKYKDIDFSRPSVPSEMAYRNRYESLQGLSYFGRPDPKAVKEIALIMEDPEDDFRLAAAAGATLGQIADDEVLKMIAAKVLDANLEERIRVNYAQALWKRPNAELSTQLLPLLEGETPTPIKNAAALAIGYAANPANDAKLVALLDNPQTRRFAAVAIALGGSEEGARKLVEVLPSDRDASEILRMMVTSNEDDNFNLITKPMFESGQIFRRLRVAEILKEGKGDVTYSYAWQHLTTRLRSGWGGPGGMADREIRDIFFKELNGQNPERRRLMANTLASMNLRGLLLAARDAKVEEARQMLLEMERPRQDNQAPAAQ